MQGDVIEIPCADDGAFLVGDVCIEEMPCILNLCRLDAYAKESGKRVEELSKEELQQFLVPRE